MEELDIKKIWQSGDDSGEFNYSSQTIDRILSQGPQNVISKFVKTLKIEQWINMVVFITTTIIFLYKLDWWVSIIILVVAVAFFLYYKTLIKKLDKEYVDSNVIQYLDDIYRIMKRFILHYKIVSFLFFFPSLLLGIYMSGGELDFNQFGVNFFVSLAVATVVTIPVVLYTIHLMYGKKAKKIKKMIDSLKKEED